ncbi:cytochrome c biogenesis ATP-binding export protein [Candidatus Photodesmus blepharus]|uniref:Cytochrome c biogenesis ATP-binding export protein n=1 Tax=Candidatus Photodesmus blepharonis TaxID=1179155 RepID=A0A084CMX2_9GAMM|nr:cytochrome c biogenesis heme-transporting ATPase CcmA [Candidatus Photodesmus blepharus]KEY91151.1 cytochrome c biogenesis ATP-binding export protein [Candidatus Photodesmus blepharus]
MLEVKHLTSIRNDRIIFKSLSFKIKFGELVQIEGYNGAGKTTLLRIIAGFGSCDDGEVYWNNENIAINRDIFHQHLLFLGHQTGLKRELTAFENLNFYQCIHAPDLNNRNIIYRALAKVGLVGSEDVPVAQLSAGQQHRVALARLWLSKKKLWILDEPMTAIDSQGTKILKKLFLTHVKEGGILMLTTHQDMFINNSKLRKIRLGT